MLYLLLSKNLNNKKALSDLMDKKEQPWCNTPFLFHLESFDACNKMMFPSLFHLKPVHFSLNQTQNSEMSY